MNKRILFAVLGVVAILALITGCGGGSDTPAPTVTVTEVAEPIADDTYDSGATDNDYSGFTSAEKEFLVDVHSMNNSIIEGNSDEQIVETGHTVCDTLDEGFTVTDVSEYLLSSGDYTTDNERGFLATMIAGAVVNLCDEYYYQITD
jgi:hypothetical protein